MSVNLSEYDEENPFDNPPSDEEIEPELVELQTEGFADYVRRLDTEQNERLQEQEHEIVRLWEARNTVLSRLESSKHPISSPIDDNLSISEVESPSDDNQSIVSQRTDYPKLIPNHDGKSPRFSFSTRLNSSQSCITPVSSFVNRNVHNRNEQTPSIVSDDRSSGVESLIPSPIQSPVLWRSEKILGRGLCSSAIDFNRINIKEARVVKPYSRNDTCSDSDVFKDVRKGNECGFFASMRARMEAAASSSPSNDTPLSFDDQYINPPLLINTKKSHFDYDEEFNYHQTYVLPKLIQEERERQKQETTIDFSFKIGLDEPTTDTHTDGTVTEDEPYLSIIVDNNNNGLKRVCSIFDQHQLVYDRDNILHDQWYYGLISYTFLLQQSVKMVNSSVMKLLQQQLKHSDTFWLSNGLKKRPIFNDSFFNIDDTPPVIVPSTTNGQTTAEVETTTIATARLNKFRQLARCFFYINCQMEWSSGALVAMNLYSPYEKLTKQPHQKWQLRFCEDFVDFIYQTKETKNPNYEYIKRLQANFIDKSVIITTNSEGFVLYIQMRGNVIELANVEPWWVARKHRERNQPVLSPRYAIQRQANQSNPQPFCSTIRLSIKVSRMKDNSQRRNDRRLKDQTIEEYEFRMDRILINNIRNAFREFLAFFYRHRIQICFAGSITDLSLKLTKPRIERPIFNTFIKNYSWQMLLSIGYRFQQRVTQQLIDFLKTIETDSEFYQTAIYIWRRAKEYHFLNIDEELMKFVERSKEFDEEKRASSPTHVSSFTNPPNNMAYAPSVTITPTTVYVKPFKLAKTNRIIREPKFGGVFNFCLVEIREETGEALHASHFGVLRGKFEEYLRVGFPLINDRIYRHLHHSQSQLKEKQYWFYWHDAKNHSNLSFEEAYTWMGDFRHESVVAKHSARIAQCFTSSEATIRVPKEKTEIIDDIERNGYIFTDGVGTCSTQLRDDICHKMRIRRKFSVMQIRYGGCKGTISVNPELDYTEKQLILRKSMHKFISTHDVLELCKISAPRPLHLNRQVIALLESRHIPHSMFLLFQTQHLLWLVESLLYLPSTYELLHERLPSHLLQLRDLILTAQIDLIHEPFFRQLITTICKHEVKRIQDKTRIQISKNSGRNMFGIVDETGILQYGQVFCQYTELDTEQLEDFTQRNYNREEKKTVVIGRIVVTKNPCHHPGDLRTFEAVDVPKLRHLVDCIVFPQQGERPHPNEISGSDLDGDEYAVYWHADLIPTGENFPPYEYDSQEKPKKLDRPVTRDDIRQVVLKISEQDALGRLSNLHLAYTDMFSIRHPDALRIAAAISEEVDAGKTGKHPLTEDEIAALARKLNNERADFFNRPKQYDLYASSNAIGILFRGIRRSEPGWLKINRCLHTKTTIGLIQSSHISAHVQIDPLLVHPLADLYRSDAEQLFKFYREQISDIMYVYHFHSEVDLICKFDSQQQTMSRQFDIADSAQLELNRLILRIKNLFNDCQLKNHHLRKCLCEDCDEHRLARASACYIVTYEQSYTKKILSFAWLFSSWLVKLRRANLAKQSICQPPSNHSLVGQAFLHSFILLIEQRSLRFMVDFRDYWCILRMNFDSGLKKFIHMPVHLMQWAMLEVTSGWLDRQEIFSTRKYAPKTATRPTIFLRTWKHVTTQFVFEQYQPKLCSTLVLLQNRFIGKQPATVTYDNGATVSLTLPQFDLSAPMSSFPPVSEWWSDEMACKLYKTFLNLTAQCSRKHVEKDLAERMDMAHLNEYLTLGLLSIAAENEFGNITWQ